MIIGHIQRDWAWGCRVVRATAAWGVGALLLVQTAITAPGAPLACTETKLIASDGMWREDFGIAVSVDADVALVGAFYKSFGAIGAQGSAYVYQRDSGGLGAWGQVKALQASDGAAFDLFGGAVAVSEGVAIIGAPLKNGPGGDLYDGAAYVYERNAGGVDNWGQVKKLLASDGSLTAQFGVCVSVANDTAAVLALSTGLWGVVTVYERNAGGIGNWGETKQLEPFDGSTAYGRGGTGQALSLHGDVLVVGAPIMNGEAGAAYVYERNAGGTGAWGRTKELLPPGATWTFGNSVAVCGDTIAIGAFLSELDGTVSIFERNAGGANNWGEVRRIVASDRARVSYFGGSVALSDSTLVVGASVKDGGAAYVFERDSGGPGNWGEVRKLRASDGGEQDTFGNAVGIAGDITLVGARCHNGNRGAAYVYTATRGWNVLDWFGLYYDAGDGWLYHMEHGWVYWTGTAPVSIWLWKDGRGWVWTGETLYPNLWSAERDSWLWYFRGTGTGSGGWFYNYGAADAIWW